MAIEVPDIQPHEPGMVDHMKNPGATRFTGVPKLENDARVSEFVDAPTVTTWA